MITRSIKGSLALAGGLILAAILFALAARQGWIGDNMDTRLVQALIGAILVVFGNAVGKREPGAETQPDPRPGLAAARRFFGLALVIGGLVHTLSWLFAPLEIANTLSMAAVILAMLIGLARVAWSLRRPGASTE
ncbi:hypothetical protein [Maricaulis sp.]|uniref:hypothetical protein n=1 Tax=Maricaulis sp. TaxID=1486257 RepID=UPI001B1C7925|nr:hypothetical protein [Maricaulis sp.]MBO6765558.1 hypothetical protein [Maricaulis sp.]